MKGPGGKSDFPEISHQGQADCWFFFVAAKTILLYIKSKLVFLVAFTSFRPGSVGETLDHVLDTIITDRLEIVEPVRA